MRYINLEMLLNKKNSWGNPKELWRDQTLRKDFRKHGFNKCWYTEVCLLGQDAPIDHWRPKAEIAQFENYNYNIPLSNCGYNWLINDPSNYRVCCIYANRKTGNGGKGNYFPLASGSPYLTAGGHEVEDPLLLDPCNKDDVNLISFLGDKVVSSSTDSNDKLRVAVSAKIYNMIDSDIEAGRRKVWDEVEKTLVEYDSGNINETVCIRRLSDSIRRDSQFSACAIACINSLASDNIKNQLDLSL